MAKKRTYRRKSSGRRERGLGVLFWLCLVAIVAAVAVAAREPIRAAYDQVTGHHPDQTAPAKPTPTVTVSPLEPAEKPAATNPTKTTVAQPAPRQLSAPKTTTQQPASVTTPPATRKARLFFATVDADGRISMKSVIRSVPATDSPLRDTLDSLLKGPTAQELNLGMVSMIPVAARLRGVVMRGDTALVDFGESFRQNPLGVEAMTTQVRQIVYAATEFPSVTSVQILIEGKKVDYLGPEGVRIDQPLTRASFTD